MAASYLPAVLLALGVVAASAHAAAGGPAGPAGAGGAGGAGGAVGAVGADGAGKADGTGLADGTGAAVSERGPLTAVVEARTRVGIAQALLGEHAYAQAHAHLAAARRLLPTWAFAHVLYAQARRIGGLDPGPSLEALAMARDLSPGSPLVLRELGLTLEAAGRTRQALDAWRALVEASPGDAQGHARLGAVALEVGELQEAASHLRIATGLDPADGVSHLLLAEALERARDLDGAEETLTAWAAAAPGEPWRWRRLVGFLRRHDRTRGLPAAEAMEARAVRARAIPKPAMRPLRSPQRKP